MFPASCKGGGMCMGAPDVLKVPSAPAPFVPAPFPNMGQCPMAILTALKVKFGNMPALHKGSEIPLSSGGEPGVLGGVVSPFYLGKVTYKMGSMKVKIEGQPAVMLLSMTGHNGMAPNCPVGSQVAPSQVVVMIGG